MPFRSLTSLCVCPPFLSVLCVPSNSVGWQSSGWSGCSPACGASGTQTQSVWCWDYTAGTYGSGCAGAAPATSQGCAIPHCYSWNYGGWSACSLTCGNPNTGSQSRTVTCMDTTTGFASPGNCGASPATTQTCSPPAVCYGWVTGAFGSCSLTCGNPNTGTQTRLVECRDITNNVVVANGNCVAAQPSATQSCSPPAVCYGWLSSAWSSCSLTCGAANSGTQTRTNQCRDITNGVNVAAGNCVMAQPATSQACTPTDHCFTWVIGGWGACSPVCGPGSQSRTVQCYDTTTSTYVADTGCLTYVGAKAALTQGCTNTDCYNWNPYPWTACSLTCGWGTQTRTYDCCQSLFTRTSSSPFLFPPSRFV